MTTTAPRRCTCHSIREGADGITYSYHMLGVLCPDCEAAIEDEQRQSWWDSLTETERIAVRWADAGTHVRWYPTKPNARTRAARLGVWSDEPPF